MKKIYPRLKRNFFARPTLIVTRELLGKHLVVERSTANVGRRCLVGRIVETEAYIGPKDKACHGSWRRRESCEVLWGPPGSAYVYLTYGLHWLLNIVTEKDNYPSAVLIRALEPVKGVNLMAENRKLKWESGKLKVSNSSSRKLSTLNFQLSISNGPAKLTQALGVDGSFNGENLESSKRIWIEDRQGESSKFKVQSSKRIGVEYAEEYKDEPWRLFIKDNPFVSGKF